MKLINENKSMIIIGIWISIFICGISLYLYGITNETLWFDEAYTAALVKHSFIDIIKITSKDVHPPLYYLTVKFFTIFLGISELVLRSISVLGGILLAGLGIWPIRKNFGNITGMIFSFLIFIIPIFSTMAQEARMYTWACFFVTGCALFGYMFIMEEKKINWILFGIFGLASAYIHYYGLISAGIIFMVIFIWLIIKSKNKLIPFLMTSSIVVVLYLPWLIILFKQIAILNKNGFWIEQVNLELIKDTILYPFNDKFSYIYTSSSILSFFSYSFLIVLLIIGLIISIYNKKKESLMSIISFSIYILTFFAVIILSLLIRPIFFTRFFFVVTGLLLLSISYGISQFKYKSIIIVICIIILLLSIPELYSTKKYSQNGPMLEISKHINKDIKKDDVFLHACKFTLGVFSYYFPNHKHYLYLPENYNGDCNYEAFKPNCDTGPDYKNFIQQNNRIWLINRIGEDNYISDEAVIKLGNKEKLSTSGMINNPKSWFAVNVTLFKNSDINVSESVLFGKIKVRVNGFKNNKGQVVGVLYLNYPYELFTPFLMVKVKKIKNHSVEIDFSDLPYNKYSFIIFHDENKNGQMDINGFIPIEGFTFSNCTNKPDGPLKLINLIDVDSIEKNVKVKMYY